jgi:iduronate 2-sulfatase
MNEFRMRSANALLLFIAISISGYAQENPKTTKPSPNVLFIVVDDLRPELGCYGNSIVKTPNIDKLAANSALFLNAYCQQAVCLPSRTSVLTGLRPNSTGVYSQKKHFRNTVPNAVTIPQHFRQHGYFSQCIGKIYHDPEWAQDSLSWSAPEILAITGRAGKYALEINKNRGTEKAAAVEVADVPDNMYIDGKVGDAAVQFLKEKRDKPFFLAVGFRRPHLPFTPPKKYWDLYDRNQIPLPKNPTVPEKAPAIAPHGWEELRGYRDIVKTGDLTPEKTRELIHGYYAAISYTDAQVGRLLDELKSSGAFENTIIVFWADHGFHLGEQHLWGKATNYELAARVPLMIKAPAVTKGMKTTALVELVDLYPTLADLCQLPAPANVEGVSLKPLLNDARKSLKKVAFTQFERPIKFKDHPQIMGYSVRTERYRYTEWQDFQKGDKVAVELYDHSKDPSETTNMADRKEYSSAIGQLSEMLRKSLQKKAL